MRIQCRLPVNRHGSTVPSPLAAVVQPPTGAEQTLPRTFSPHNRQRVYDYLHLATSSLQADEMSHLFRLLAPLLRSVKVKDAQLYRHSLRVEYLAQHLACMCGLAQGELMTVGLGGLLHDVGKLCIQDELLQKATHLSLEEFTVMKEHPAYGARILSQFEVLTMVIPIVYAHHERWDGAGYPCGLRGEAIPLGARMVAIADAFEVMTSYRPYQAIRTPIEALEELRMCAGTQFDPLLVECFYHHSPLFAHFNEQAVGPGGPAVQ